MPPWLKRLCVLVQLFTGSIFKVVCLYDGGFMMQIGEKDIEVWSMVVLLSSVTMVQGDSLTCVLEGNAVTSV